MAFDRTAAQAQIAGNIAYVPSATLSWSAPGGGAPLSLPAMIEDESPEATRIDPNPGDDTPVRITIARSLFGAAIPRQNQYFTAGDIKYRITAVRAHPSQHVAVFTCNVIK